MMQSKKDVERKDTETFIKEVLEKVPKGPARERVLELTGLAALLITHQSSGDSGSAAPLST